jgi:nucleoside-diphosphate-sugar epimerase
MKVLLFGATGMVGQGALRECLLAPEVERVLAVGRSPTGRRHPKLQELVVPDLTDLGFHTAKFSGHDACVERAGSRPAPQRDVPALPRTILRPGPAARPLVDVIR